MDVLDAIRQPRSVRSFSTQPIPDEVMQQMREAIRSAPSACNYQPWHFVLVKDDRLRRQLAVASSDQVWMADAPVTVVACGFPDRAYKKMGGSGNSVEIDIAIALDHLALAAVTGSNRKVIELRVGAQLEEFRPWRGIATLRRDKPRASALTFARPRPICSPTVSGSR